MTSDDKSGPVGGADRCDGPEIATDFIPLMGRETLAQMDGGQVMRVELGGDPAYGTITPGGLYTAPSVIPISGLTTAIKIEYYSPSSFCAANVPNGTGPFQSAQESPTESLKRLE